MSKITEHINLLRRHNKWRRGDESVEMPNPTELGIAIDAVCDAVEGLIAERDRAEEVAADREWAICEQTDQLAAVTAERDEWERICKDRLIPMHDKCQDELADMYQEVKAVTAERNALLEYKNAIDNALIVGPQTTVDAFPSAKAALHHLINWEIQVSSDPLVSDSPMAKLTAERDALLEALRDLHNSAGVRMMADEPTGDECIAFLNAWKAAGELLEGGAK